MPGPTSLPAADSGFIERTVGTDRVIFRTVNGATMVFGLGPPRGAPSDARLSALLGDVSGEPTRLRWCRQIHGSTIHHVDAGDQALREIGKGDGMVTNVSGVGLVVWTADCVPVLLAGAGTAAAVHSGWRGCAADVVGAAVEELCRRWAVTANQLHAALGPSVCGACYEVGGEVIDALQSFQLPEERWLRRGGVDLRAFLGARLEALGVPVRQIDTVGGCTVESQELASYRRDGTTAGRQWSMVFLER